jgi:glycogen synthase
MKKVLIISVLKPVDDVRSYGKIGLTLADAGCDVHIAGFHSSNADAKKVNFYPLFKFNRLSLQRAFAPFRLLELMFRLKPAVVIVSAHELLACAVVYKILAGSKLIYDVQENYFMNIMRMNTFPAGIRNLLGWYVRMKEIILTRFFDAFLLAERCYENEIRWARKGKYMLLENKPTEKNRLSRHSANLNFSDCKHLKLVYTGTIASDYGIEEAIDFAVRLQKEFNGVTLDIIGVCRDEILRNKILSGCKKYQFISARIESVPVPYEEIQQAQSGADILLLPYKPGKATADRIPTRLYEGLANGIPMIIQHNKTWQEIADKFNAAVFIDYNKSPVQSVLAEIKSKKFYNVAPGKEIWWESDEKKLTDLVAGIS